MRGSLPKYMPKQIVTGRGTDGKLQGHTTEGDINFNLDNAQNLAIYICASVPNIPAASANEFVDEVLGRRHNSTIGFTNAEVEEFKHRLAKMEREAIGKTLV